MSCNLSILFLETYISNGIIINIINIPYSKLLSHEDINNSLDDGPEIFKKYRSESNSDLNSPKKSSLDKILEERNLDFDIGGLENFWFQKVDTIEKPLAFVAIDILGTVITSVASRKSFSQRRLIIHEQRTRNSSEHANQQMVIQLNPDEAKKAISISNIFIIF